MLTNVSGTSWPGISTDSGSTKGATIENTATVRARWIQVTSRGGTAQRRNGAPIASVPLKCPATRPAMLVMRMTSSGRKNERVVTAEKEKVNDPSSSRAVARAAKMTWRRKSTSVIARVATPIRIHVDTRLGAGDRRSLIFVIHHSRPTMTMVTTRGAPVVKMFSWALKLSGALMSRRSAAEPNRDRAIKMNGRA